MEAPEWRVWPFLDDAMNCKRRAGCRELFVIFYDLSAAVPAATPRILPEIFLKQFEQFVSGSWQ